MSNKKKIFDGEYAVRFGLLCLIAIGLILLSWTYKFKSNTILTINDSNQMMFNDKFGELADASQYGEYRIVNLSIMGQRQARLENIDRSQYIFDVKTFAGLAPVPNDWAKYRYAYDLGKFYVLTDMKSEYYTQPEFYDDWFSLGIGYNEYAMDSCKNGFFATPAVQRVYTKSGASIETYAVFRTSFCVGGKQAFAPKAIYPAQGITYDGIEYTQNPEQVKKYITVSFSPYGYVLGRTFPVFESNWAQKSKITIDVSPDTPKGLYVVSVGAQSYKPLISFDSDVNYDAYKSKENGILMNFVVGVD